MEREEEEEGHLSIFGRHISLRSSVTSSRSTSSSSVGTYSYCDRVACCEVEEIASFRWLPSPLRWRASPRTKRGRVDAKRRTSNGSAAESALHIDWGRLLASNYLEILSRAVDPLEEFSSSSEQLYRRLCEPILIDGGLKMMWLEKATGRRCCTLSAREIQMWGVDARYWKWTAVPDASFPEVAQLADVSWLEMKASVSSRELSPGTTYGAYLVMRDSDVNDDPSALECPLQDASVSVGGVLSSTREVLLLDRPCSGWSAQRFRGTSDGIRGPCVPRVREDGWMEVEMGDFFIGSGREEVVDVRLRGRKMQRLGTKLIVHGLEMRPMP